METNNATRYGERKFTAAEKQKFAVRTAFISLPAPHPPPILVQFVTDVERDLTDPVRRWSIADTKACLLLQHPASTNVQNETTERKAHKGSEDINFIYNLITERCGHSDYTALDNTITNEQWITRSRSTLTHGNSIYPVELRKTKTLVRITDILAGNWTRDLSNKKECHPLLRHDEMCENRSANSLYCPVKEHIDVRSGVGKWSRLQIPFITQRNVESWRRWWERTTHTIDCKSYFFTSTHFTPILW